MEKVGILNVCYGGREGAINDTLFHSGEYEVELFIVDKQLNPFNLQLAEKSGGRHIVDPELSIETIVDFARKYKEKIRFALCPNEGPIINGMRNVLEWDLGIPTICPTKEYALEGSKVRQRLLLEEVMPEANPQFRVFDPTDYKSKGKSLDDLFKDAEDWIKELGGVTECVIKPDCPGFGKGVGVGGEHFHTMEEAKEWMDLNKFIIEKKLDGEEVSFQAYCDGKRIIPLPDTRDYKRSHEDDIGLNTGGMGSWSDVSENLPFSTPADREKEIETAERILKYFTKEGRNSGLLGMPLYTAFMLTSEGPKILEINSREGDPEIMCVLPRLKEDLVNIYSKILDGNLSKIEVTKEAVVTTYVVPDVYPKKDDIVREVNLTGVYNLTKRYGDKIKVYPASIGVKNERPYALGSRSVAVVGIGDDIQSARDISLTGASCVDGVRLRYRQDIASREHINKSIEHMRNLRS